MSVYSSIFCAPYVTKLEETDAQFPRTDSGTPLEPPVRSRRNWLTHQPGSAETGGDPLGDLGVLDDTGTGATYPRPCAGGACEVRCSHVCRPGSSSPAERAGVDLSMVP